MINQTPIRKFVFVLSCEVDEVIITTLAKKLLPDSFSFHVVTVGMDTASFNASYISIIELLRKGYQHFFLLFDTNTIDENEITQTQALIAEPMKRYGLLEYVTFCPIIPNLNAWLLGKYQLPEKQFGQKFNLPKIAKVANSIDIMVLQRQNASFKWFAERLQQLTRTDKVVLKRAA